MGMFVSSHPKLSVFSEHVSWSALSDTCTRSCLASIELLKKMQQEGNHMHPEGKATIGIAKNGQQLDIDQKGRPTRVENVKLRDNWGLRTQGWSEPMSEYKPATWELSSWSTYLCIPLPLSWGRMPIRSSPYPFEEKARDHSLSMLSLVMSEFSFN